MNLVRKIYITILVIVVSFGSFSQKNKKNQFPNSTSAEERWKGYQKRNELIAGSLVKNLSFQNIGPTIMSGRVVDLEVNPNDPTHFYVAYASGGLWETKNEGASFQPLFDNEIVMSIGDIAVDWKNSILYIGSGENNSSRSSYSGYGMFKSEDNGKTWKHIGLSDSHHIGRIIINPEDPNNIIVGVLGHLYSKNDERGVYITNDGGENWERSLFINDQTGIVDMAINPSNSNELIAAAWQKDRKAWNFIEAGDGSGIYRSTDGGKNWTNISSGENGFPDTDGMGRVGLDYGPNNEIFVVLDNQDRRKSEEEKDEFRVTKEKLKAMTNEDFMKLPNNEINSFLDRNSFPQKYNAVDLKTDIENGKIKPSDLVIYLEDANSLLFDTPVIGGEVYISSDNGNSWNKTHEGYIESFVFSYGYYFGQIRVDQSNPNNIYILGVPILASSDGGKTWESIDKGNVHADHHALWIDPKRSGHLILGNDGGVNISYDNGDNWIICNSLPVGQFYTVNVDMAEPYNVYGGLQDNGVWKGPSTYEFGTGWHSEGKYPYQRIMGGDGMQVVVDTRNNTLVYTGYQFGNYFRIDTETGKRKYITPSHELGDSPLRWNWQAPIQLSSHNQDIVYFGSNKFHRSMNKGDSFETLSEDLTNGGKPGDVSFGTLTTISESPLRFGLIYVGSDDGLIHVSKDGGESWSKITEGLPKNYWVSRVFASKHSEERVYITLNGYRWDNFNPMVYMSNDYGKTWKNISSNLPAEPVNVVKEDPVNENIIYIGTDHGAYLSLNQGGGYMAFQGGLPAVSVHDLVIQTRENDIILGTHGRSFFKASLKEVQQLSSEVLEKDIHVFSINDINYSERWGNKWWTWGDTFEPGLTVPFYSNSEKNVTISIMKDESELFSEEINAEKGLNYYKYDLSIEEDKVESLASEDKVEQKENGKFYLSPGVYKVNVSDVTIEFEIKERKRRSGRKE